MINKIKIISLCITIIATIFINSAYGSGLIAMQVRGEPGPVGLYSINPITAAATFLTEINLAGGFDGLTFLGGQLYTTSRNPPPSHDPIPGVFKTGTIDHNNGNFTGISEFGAAGLAANEADELLYFLDGGNPTDLFSLAPNGTISSVSITGDRSTLDGGGMAYDDTNSILYSTAGIDGDTKLFTVDPITGVSTFIGDNNLGPIGRASQGLAFDESSGILYTIVSETPTQNYLYTINTTTGAATLVGDTGISGLSLNSIAWSESPLPFSSVPEPSDYVLIFTGLIGLVVSA